MKFKRKTLVFNTIFLFSLLSNVINLKLYQATIISIEIIGICYVLAFLTFILIKNKFQLISPWHDNIINFIFISFVVGSLLTLSFLSTNYFFAKRQTEDKIFKIIRKTEMIRRRHKTFLVFIKIESDQEKRFDFNGKDEEKVDQAHSLKLSLSKGGLNYYIIRGQELR